MTLNIHTVSKFVMIRNKSPHPSNLQFLIDLKSAGIDVKEFPDPTKRDENWYEWDLGFCLMTEKFGLMHFVPTP